MGLHLLAGMKDLCFFGLQGAEKELSTTTDQALRQLIAKSLTYWHPLASDIRHPLFRAQPERWMQSNLRDDVTRVDVALGPEHVYEQVLTPGYGQRGIMDLVCATRAGRLALLELKATGNINLPPQAADYYSRIRQHLAGGELTRHEYFTGLQLQQAPRLVLRYLSPDSEIYSNRASGKLAAWVASHDPTIDVRCA